MKLVVQFYFSLIIVFQFFNYQCKPDSNNDSKTNLNTILFVLGSSASSSSSANETSQDTEESEITIPTTEEVFIVGLGSINESVYLLKDSQKKYYFRCYTNDSETETVLNLKLESNDFDISSFSFENSNGTILCDGTFNVLEMISPTDLQDGVYTVSLIGENSDLDINVNLSIPIYVGNYFIQIEQGQYQSIGLSANGEVYTWGTADESSPLGDGTIYSSYRPVLVKDLNHIIQVSVGEKYFLALKEDGTVWSWGSNKSGQLGINSITTSSIPNQVMGENGNGYLENIVKITTGSFHSLALKNDGSVYSWGDNTYGQLGHGSMNIYTTYLVPKKVISEDQVTSLSQIVDIDANNNFTLALKEDGTARSWGYNAYGQLSTDDSNNYYYPAKMVIYEKSKGIFTFKNIKKVSAGGDFSLVLNYSGEIYGSGSGYQYRLYPNSSTWNYTYLVLVNFQHDAPIVDISTGSSYSFSVDAMGNFYSFGDNSDHRNGNENTAYNSARIISKLNNYIRPRAGYASSAVFKIEGKKLKSYSFGDNRNGTLGDGTSYDFYDSSDFDNVYSYANNFPLPILEPDNSVGSNLQYLSNVNSISVGPSESLILKNDGTVWSIGNDLCGQISLGNFIHYVKEATPSIDFFGNKISNVKQVEVSKNGVNSTILKNDGTVWGVGDCSYIAANIEGCSDTIDFLHDYVQIRGGQSGSEFLTNIKQISAGYSFTLGLDNEGKVWAWGSNESYQLGNGSQSSYYYPVQVIDNATGLQLSNILKIQAGFEHSLALSTSGQVYGWGFSKYGQAGGIETLYQKKADKIYLNSNFDILGNIKDIAVGTLHSLALTNDGKVYAWGWDNYGELGNDTDPLTTDSSSNPFSYYPIFVKDSTGSSDLSNVVKITANGNYGSGFSFAVTSTGQGYAWGRSVESGIFCNNSPGNIIYTLPTPMLDSNGNVLQNLNIVYSGYVEGGDSPATFMSLNDGSIYSCGMNKYGSLGIGLRGDAQLLPVRVKERIE